MSTRLNPYIGFRDNARQALEFYRSVFGGELQLSTFADFGAGDDPAEAGKIMHGQLEAENGLVLMAADTPNAMEHSPGGNVSISLSGDDEPTLRGYWEKLADGGTVTEPLQTAPWGDAFGMCTDRFGVAWLVNITGAPPQ
ncbi:VOC family protein [Jiangella sp. DSM 45060]|uniref:VOC family protein n=1 Tax=Jiangella sp. DSM 45060 TaxID=1798224 RepID=UPI00087CE1CF|nr:VOC family protein [Jiangella sp. DSM 45060]SDS81994.1 PhnB protein [Jiangella sp. DSM 45060]